GHSAGQHVPVFAVVAPDPVLDLVVGAAGDGRGPRALRVRLVVRVERVQPTPAFELLAASTGEGAPAGLLIRALAGGRHGPDDRCRGPHERAEPLLTVAQRFLGSL